MWLKQHMKCSDSCFAIALIYIDTVNINCDRMRIDGTCIHRLFVTGLMLAAKFYDDVFYKNKYYARIAGVSNKEINKLEYQLLVMLKFKLVVDPQVFKIYKNQLKDNFLS
mmetsp:Transcript_35441/g.6387  ORF Transcript_35441/g.6387 Transcript_35441/m.6387 type:complete len:110 (+) Transcript_35441:119-448(+)